MVRYTNSYHLSIIIVRYVYSKYSFMEFKYLGCFLLECRRFDDILHPFLALICNIVKQLRISNSDICSIYICKTLDNEFEDDW
jgi:hypothetical protein